MSASGEYIIRDSSAQISPTAVIAETAVIGTDPRPLLTGKSWEAEFGATMIGDRVAIGDYSVIGRGAWIGADSILDVYTHVEAGAKIGKRVLLTRDARVGITANVGDDCIIRGGLVCEGAQVKYKARVFGSLLHAQLDPSTPWDAPGEGEPSPIVEAEAYIGVDARIIGKVVVGRRAYVCAGATVTRDVPPLHIAYGENRVVPFQEWRGKLAQSPFFREET